MRFETAILLAGFASAACSKGGGDASQNAAAQNATPASGAESAAKAALSGSFTFGIDGMRRVNGAL